MKNFTDVSGLADGEADLELDAETERIVAAAYSRLFGGMHEPGDLETEVLQHEVFARLFAEEAPAPAVTLGPYVITSLIASGGMGAIYRGHHPYLRQEHAVKLLHPHAVEHPAERDRLIGEAQALAKLSHPNVVRVYTCGEHEGQPYIGMELIDGTTLTQWLAQEKRPWSAVVANFEAAGRGLAAAHAEGILHGDFKPDNVLIAKGGQVQVVDFGLTTAAEATIAEEGLRAHTRLRGTPYYMAPEQFLGAEATERSDQFSFCVALFDALFDGHPYVDLKRPVRASQLATTGVGPDQTAGGVKLAQLVEGVQTGRLRMPVNTRVPRRVLRALRRGLARDPAERFASMDLLLTALTRDPIRRWAPWLGLGLGVATMIGAVYQQRGPGPVCSALEGEFAGVWNEARRQAVRAAFERTAAPTAKAAMVTVERTMTRYAEDWLAAREQTCERPAQAQLVCLLRARAQADAAMVALTAVDQVAIERVPDTLRRLPDPADCIDPIALAHRCDPVDADDALVERLDDALGHEIAGDYRGAEALAKEVAERAVAVKAKLVEAKARLLRGRVLQEGGQAEAAMRELNAALTAAEGVTCDVMAAEIQSRRNRTLALNAGLKIEDDPQIYAAALNKLEAVEDRGTRLAEAESAFGLLLFRRYDGELARAEKLLREARDRQADAARSAGLEMTPELANAELDLGKLLEAQGRLKEALQRLRAAIVLYEEVYSPQHPGIWDLHLTVGRVLLRLGSPKEARQELEEALSLARAAHGDSSLPVAKVLVSLANLALQDTRVADALKHAQAAVDIQRRIALPTEQAMGLDMLADVYVELGEPEHQKKALELRQEIRRTAADRTPMGLGEADLGVARVLQEMGRDAEALPLCDSALEHLRMADSVKTRHLYRAALLLRSDVLRALGRMQDALVDAREVLAVTELVASNAVEDHEQLASAQWLAAQAQATVKGDMLEACELAMRSLVHWQDVQFDALAAEIVEWRGLHCKPAVR